MCRQSGGFSSTWTNASYECSGNSPQYAGIVFYGLSLARSVSAIIGPIISGLLLEAGTGSSFGGRFGKFGYGAVEIFVGSCALATGPAALRSRWRGEGSRPRGLRRCDDPRLFNKVR